MAKTVLITGCSRGIGLALVKECVNLGHKVSYFLANVKACFLPLVFPPRIILFACFVTISSLFVVRRTV
jgi:nucleoside-diphosphate-sugar epimerase